MWRMDNRLVVWILLMLVLTSGLSGCATTRHIEGFRDIPLYPNAKLRYLSLKRQLPDGRLYNVVSMLRYTTYDRLNSIKSFYEKEIPKFGWRKVSTSKFSITYEKDDSVLELKFGVAGKEGNQILYQVLEASLKNG